MYRQLWLSGKLEVFTIVDAVEYERLSSGRWYLGTDGHVRGSCGDFSGLMHRLLMDSPDGMDVYHLNGDKADNRRLNLEVVTHAENVERNGFPRQIVEPHGFESMQSPVTCRAQFLPGYVAKQPRWTPTQLRERAELKARLGL